MGPGFRPIFPRVSSAHRLDRPTKSRILVNCARPPVKKRYDRVAREPGLLEARAPIRLLGFEITVALPERTPAQSTSSEKRSVGQGVFRKCTGCGVVNTVEDLSSRFYVCPSCGYHPPDE